MTAGSRTGRRDPADAVVTDLTDVIGATGLGVHWTLAGSRDLNANLVHLAAGEGIGDHVNEEVDVLVVVLAGRGRVTVDGEAHAVARSTVAHLPRGAVRALAAEDDGLWFLSIHRRRGPLGIGPRRS